MSSIHIWFNRTFSTTYNIIQDIRKGNLSHEFKFFGTHPNLQSVFLKACDIIETEPILDDVHYLTYALDFCERYEINLFFPGEFSSNLIAKHVHLFEGQGIKVALAFKSDIADVLSSKIQIYGVLRSVLHNLIPKFQCIQNINDFQKVYQEQNVANVLTCLKPDRGLGGLGFRIIDNSVDQFKQLLNYPSPSNTYGYYHQILSAEGEFAPLIFMDYLYGPEISVDCLAMNGKLLFSVAREKRGKLRIVKQMPDLHQICSKICAIFSLNYIFNIQFRFGRDGQMYLLDLNARPSGGLYYTHLAGYPMMSAAVSIILGNQFDPFNFLPEQTFIQIEGAIPYNDLHK
jgi:hypothetical protein